MECTLYLSKAYILPSHTLLLPLPSGQVGDTCYLVFPSSNPLPLSPFSPFWLSPTSKGEPLHCGAVLALSL